METQISWDKVVAGASLVAAFIPLFVDRWNKWIKAAVVMIFFSITIFFIFQISPIIRYDLSIILLLSGIIIIGFPKIERWIAKKKRKRFSKLARSFRNSREIKEEFVVHLLKQMFPNR